jgi:hypothetical protein
LKTDKACKPVIKKFARFFCVQAQGELIDTIAMMSLSPEWAGF